MPQAGWLAHLTKLILIFFLTHLPVAAFAADDLAARKVIFDCEQRAAAYTKAMGKPGNKKLYEQHLKDCLKVMSPSPGAPRRVMSSASPCKEGEHAFTFKNGSSETIWLGVWDDGASVKGVPPPANWPNWELAAGQQNRWCAPDHFNGRFIIRARCNISTGFCEEGNCITEKNIASNKMTCTVGAEPASLAEFTFDKNTTKNTPLGVTWYDVSYVDGYNFPILIESNDTNCSSLGKGELPSCPWPTINGVCLGPYRQYALNNPWYRYEQDYYTLAAMCASPEKDICGCGNQCTEKQNAVPGRKPCETTYILTRPDNGQKVTVKSSGCSPFNPTYDTDKLALEQVVCDPLGSDGKNKCFFEWPEKYKTYVKKIHELIPKAYTWQYHDDDSLTSCATAKDQSFTITIGKRPVSSENAYAVSFNPASAHGNIAVNDEPPVKFVGGNPFQKALKEHDKVTIGNACPGDTGSVECTATFFSAKGLVSDDPAGSICRDKAKSGIDWGDRQNVAIGPPDNQGCYNFTIFMAENFHAQIWKNDKQLKDIQGKDPYSLNLADNDKVKLVVDCQNDDHKNTGKTVTCIATYKQATGMLNLDSTGNDLCLRSKDALTFGKTPNELHPGIPNDAVCK
jgi:hypothetical protein